jgi:RNA polymerase sigma-70 factor, ECF subfamily
MDENEAISRIRQGDLTGLEELINRYQETAVRSAFLIVQQRTLAEETAQNAFVKIVEKIALFDDSRPFAPWFFRIVVNDAIKIAHHQNQMECMAEEADDDQAFTAKWLIDSDPLPEEQMVIKENRAKLLGALKRLSAEQRAVVVMRYYLQLPENEMSIRLSQPLSTVKWWLRVARKRLKLSLSTEDAEYLESGRLK